MTEKNEFKQRPVPALIAQTAALAAGMFTVVIALLLIADHVRLLKMDPLNDPVLLELREELAKSTGNHDAVIEKIRTYDLYARRAFFGNQEQRRVGGTLLLAGAVACFVSLKLSWLWKPRLPAVEKSDQPDHWELNRLFRQLMAGAGIFLVVISFFLAFSAHSDLTTLLERQAGKPALQGDAPVEAAQAAEPAFAEQMKANWPSLRGWGNIGHAHTANAPMEWDVKSGDGLLWKTEVYVHGFNSPIVWGSRIFMSGADEEGQEVFCFDADTGKQLWTKTVETSAELPDVAEEAGYSAPTMTTDGQRVFVIFATGELAAFDLEGNPVWQKNIGLPENPYGMGSSLISDGVRLFVQYDHQDSQKVMAFDGKTGELVWETARTLISWSSPSLIETGSGLQLILNDEENVTAYDPATGDQLWQVECLGGEVAPSPAFNGKDIVFVGNEYAQASALKLTGGTPEILWQYDEYLPEISSPLAAEDRFFITSSAGDIICLDAATGEVLWEHECDEGFTSSPILVGDRVYSIDLAGVVHIFAVNADTYHEIAAIDMGESVYATPAFVGDRIYIRGDMNLYCIGEH